MGNQTGSPITLLLEIAGGRAKSEKTEIDSESSGPSEPVVKLHRITELEYQQFEKQAPVKITVTGNRGEYSVEVQKVSINPGSKIVSEIGNGSKPYDIKIYPNDTYSQYHNSQPIMIDLRDTRNLDAKKDCND